MKFNKMEEAKKQRVGTQVVDEVGPDLDHVEPDRLPPPTPTGTPDGATLAQPATAMGQVPEAPTVSPTSPLTAPPMEQDTGTSHIRAGFDGLVGSGYLNPSNWSVTPMDGERIEFVHVNGTVVRSNTAEFNLFLTTGGR
jgi:hypothetical protein